MKLAIVVQTPEVKTTIPVALLSGSLEQKLAKAASLGFDGVELLTTNPAELNTTEIRQMLSATGLQVSAVASGGLASTTGLTLLNPDEKTAGLAHERLKDLIRFSASLGAPLVTIGSFKGRLVTSQLLASASKRVESLKISLLAAAEFAHSQGVRLVIEPLNRYETDLVRNAGEGLELIEAIGHPALGLLLDIYHMNIEESSWSGPFSAAMASERLWYVHIGDNNRLPPGRGMIDFKNVLACLHSAGYQGFLSAELLALPDPDTAAQQTIRHISPILRELLTA
jgi:5-keto-L-gluconate epimerase